MSEVQLFSGNPTESLREEKWSLLAVTEFSFCFYCLFIFSFSLSNVKVISHESEKPIEETEAHVVAGSCQCHIRIHTSTETCHWGSVPPTIEMRATNLLFLSFLVTLVQERLIRNKDQMTKQASSHELLQHRYITRPTICHFDRTCDKRIKSDFNKLFSKGYSLYTFTGKYQGQAKVNHLNRCQQK